MTLRSEPDAPARSVTSDDVSSWPEIERQLVKACAIFAGDSSVNGRMQAAGQLGPHTTHDAVSEMSVVEVFTTAYEGSLEDCSTILDVHYRLLGAFVSFRLSFLFLNQTRVLTSHYLIDTAETLIQRNTELVEHVYEKFAALPPRLRKSSLRATAACAEAGLLHTREEYEMMNAVLSEVVESGDADEGVLMEFEKNNAMLKAMDDMLEAMLKNVSDW